MWIMEVELLWKHKPFHNNEHCPRLIDDHFVKRCSWKRVRIDDFCIIQDWHSVNKCSQHSHNIGMKIREWSITGIYKLGRDTCQKGEV